MTDLTLCSMVERRKGGESGVKSVQYLAGQAVWEARDAGLWSQELAEAAVAACVAGGKSTVPAGSTSLEDCEEPAVFLIECGWFTSLSVAPQSWQPIPPDLFYCLLVLRHVSHSTLKMQTQMASKLPR